MKSVFNKTLPLHEADIELDASEDQFDTFFFDYFEQNDVSEEGSEMTNLPSDAVEKCSTAKDISVHYSEEEETFYFVKEEEDYVSFSMEFNSCNQAFVEDPEGEVVRILEDMIAKVKRQGFDEGKIRDVNGNGIGEFAFDLRKVGQY